MSKFKSGDFARCIAGGAPSEYTVGKVYKVSSVCGDRIMTELDDRGSSRNGWCEKFFEKVEQKFKVGDAVYYDGLCGRHHGIVCERVAGKSYDWADGTEVWAIWGKDGAYPSWMPADRVFADKTRGQIISELRKAAGLPAFVVGDVVSYTRDRSRFQNTTIVEYLPAFVWYSDGEGCFSANELELVSPAPTVVAEVRSTERAFVVGQWVRVIDGEQIGQVTEDDGDFEDSAPYTVEFLDGDYGYFDAEELIPWVPHAGERVTWTYDNDDAGTVIAMNDEQYFKIQFDSYGDDSVSKRKFTWSLPTLIPSDKPAPRKPLKKGDRVAYLGNLFMLNMPKGAMATLYEDQEGSTIRVKWDTRGGAFDGAYNVAGFELTTAPAVVESTFKRGDVVEVVKPGHYRTGIKMGDIGVVADSQTVYLHHETEGAIPQLYSDNELKLAA